MILFPEDAAEKLGVGRVKARLEDFTESDAARRLVRALEPEANIARVRQRLAVAGELQACLSFDDPIPFAAVSELNSALNLARPEGAALSVDLILEVYRSEYTSRLLSSYLGSRKEKYATVAGEWSDLSSDIEFENVVTSTFDDDGQVLDGASPELRNIRRGMRNAREKLRVQIGNVLKKATADGYAAEDQATIRSGRMVIPVEAGSKRRVAGFIHDVSSTGQTVFIEPQECLELNNQIRELEVSEAREMEDIRRTVTDSIRARSEPIAKNNSLLIHFDLALAIARLANDMSAEVPALNEDGQIIIRQGRNPELHLVYKAQHREESIIPLDFELGKSFKTLVISGPNAGGKSIALKTVGLMTVMLGMGIPVPARADSTFSLFSRLMVDIGDAQSVEDDLSTYSSHLENLSTMLKTADADSLVLIDEAGTGTDPDEGAAIAQAILENLTLRAACTVATTHHGGLKVFAHDEEGVANGSMSFDMQTLKPTFSFRLDVPGASYATEIASKVGLPDEVIARARELIGTDKMRMESLISSLDESNRLLDARLNEVTSTLQSAEKDRDSLVAKLDALQAEKETIKKRAVEEAELIIRDANKIVERVVREIKEAKAEAQQTKAARSELKETRTVLAQDAKRLQKRISSRKSKRLLTASPKMKESTGERLGPLKEGDRVVLDSSASTGEVLSIKGNEATILLGSLQTRVSVGRLIKVGEAAEQQVTIRHAGGESGLRTASLQQRIDVRGLRVDEALPRVVSLIDEAVAANLKNVEVLHGKGTGALRQAIREYLASSEAVIRFEDAEWEAGGPGITVAWLV